MKLSQREHFKILPNAPLKVLLIKAIDDENL